MVEIASQAAKTSPTYRPKKLEAALLFFLKHANNSHLGKTKLMKLLYYADFDHAELYGEPITGARYRKLPQGPVPSEAMGKLDSMATSGQISVTKNFSGPYVQNRYEALEEPDMSVFCDSEISVLEQVVARWGLETMSSIVAASHSEAPWLAVAMGEDIPYRLANFRSGLNTRQSIEIASDSEQDWGA